MSEQQAFELQDATVVVTGGSRGIGSAVARKFGSRGARVVVNYRQNADAAEAVVDDIERHEGRGFAKQADVSDPKQSRKLIQAAEERYGSLDVLVNNAGVCRPAHIDELESEAIDEVMDTNLKGVFYVTKHAVGMMKQQGRGAIINLSSIAGQMGTVDAAYAASKAGILGFTKALARELGPHGIRVNAVSPGPVETDMGDEILNFLEETDFHGHENLDTFLDAYAAQPEQIAKGVAYLAESDFVTGETLTINGGMYTE